MKVSAMTTVAVLSVVLVGTVHADETVAQTYCAPADVYARGYGAYAGRYPVQTLVVPEPVYFENGNSYYAPAYFTEKKVEKWRWKNEKVPYYPSTGRYYYRWDTGYFGPIGKHNSPYRFKIIARMRTPFWEK